MMEIVQKKVCLLGDFAVGKTSLVRRFVDGRFEEKYLSTIGVSISRKSLEREGYRLNLLLWDLAGGEEFVQYQTSYLRGAAGALVVCDITRGETLKTLTSYAEQIQAVSSGASMVFVANKVDLEGHYEFDHTDLRKVGQTWESPVLLTSAKTGQEVEEGFHLLAEKIEFT